MLKEETFTGKKQDEQQRTEISALEIQFIVRDTGNVTFTTYGKIKGQTVMHIIPLVVGNVQLSHDKMISCTE